jgi:hypothetical protein
MKVTMRTLTLAFAREGKRPKTNDDWEVVAEHATQLAAAGSL